MLNFSPHLFDAPLRARQGNMQLTLLVPELIWPEPDDPNAFSALQCPALNTLLARSQLDHRPTQSLEATLTNAFGQGENAPYAAFRLLGEPTPQPVASDAYWLCCDPVHLRFHQEHLVLADSACFALQMEEAQAFASALNEHFADLGRFHVATAERWYLQLTGEARPDRFDVPPLSAVAGRRVESLLPKTTQAKALRQLFTEAQMLLHAHAINRQREAAGEMPVNALWLWGGGTLPPQLASNFDGVWSNNPLAQGLARAASLPSHALPDEATAWLTHAAPAANHLIILEDLLETVQYERSEAYVKAINALEQHWFAPLYAELGKGKFTQLRIESSTAYGTLHWTSRRADLWKLWRRPQPLRALAQNLAKDHP